MTKCATSIREFEDMALSFILDVINEKGPQIIEMEKPRSEAFGSGEHSLVQSLFNYFKNFQEEFKSELYGERSETELQKLGCEHATALISYFIATGKYYEGNTAIDVRNSGQLGGLMLKETINMIDEIAKQKDEPNNSDSQGAPEQSGQTSTKKHDKCIMF